MLLGQIKTAGFFDDNQNAIFGGIKGVITGGILGGSKDMGQHRTFKTRLKNISNGALIGAVIGSGFGHGLDTNKDKIRDFVDEKVDGAKFYLNHLLQKDD